MMLEHTFPKRATRCNLRSSRMTILLKYLCVASLVPVIAATDSKDESVVKIDFGELPNGSPIKSGMYLHDEWHSKYGLLLSASGGFSNKPRLFDSLHPGTKELGDPDLGSPNERCGGPGKGEGGEPDAPGANCKPLGNILIIQEDNDHPNIPDDNVDGGVITLHFDKPVRFAEIGLLDIDYKSFLRVVTSKSGKTASFDLSIPMLGDNSAQTIKIDTDNVVQLDLNLRRSGAITFFSFYSSSDHFLKIGEPCNGGCAPDLFCFNAVLPGGVLPAGVCSCNPIANTGCKEGEVCAYSPLVDIGPPQCFLPMGALCSTDSECVSDNCYEERCMCNQDLDNFPCAADEFCSFGAGRGYYECRMVLKDVDEECLKDFECETGYCWADWFIEEAQPGICKCNARSQIGCSEGRTCVSSPIPGSPPDCFLTAGELCENDDECFSGSCVDNKCTICNEATNFPCPPDMRCVPDDDEEKGYSCLEMIGNPCVSDDDCETGVCWSEYPPGPPGLSDGVCVCAPGTNQGCTGVEECTSRPGTFNEPPSCYLPIGTECEVDIQCLSDHCYNEECVCNLDTNFPCADNEACVFKDSKYTCEACVVPDQVENCPWDIPVTCNGCHYANECLALRASYRPPTDCMYSNEFVPGPDPGHLYKAFEEREISWQEARDRVNSLSRKCGYVIHLATITSPEEDVFVHERGRDIHGYKPGIPTGFWVGGFQNLESKDFREPGGGWEWVAHEGPIKGYENWGENEPNDFRGQPQNPDKLPENQMTVCRFDKSAKNDAGKATGWNDEFPGAFIRGYIAEAEVDYLTVFVHSCDSGVENLRLPSPPGCPPGQISTFISGCAGNNRDEAFFECVAHIAHELELADLITADEKNKIISCI